MLSPARLTELMVLFGKRTNLQKKKVSAPLRLCASAVKKSLLYEIIKPA